MLAILADGNVHSMADIHDELCKKFGLTPDEIKTRIASGNQTIIRNRVGWARTYLSKARLLEIPQKAHTRITERGRQALTECRERVDVKYLKRFEEFRLFHARFIALMDRFIPRWQFYRDMLNRLPVRHESWSY